MKCVRYFLAEKNNSVGEQPGEDVVASFAAAGLFDHMGNDAHTGLPLDFFCFYTKQVDAQRCVEACCGKYTETLDHAEILGRNDFHARCAHKHHAEGNACAYAVRTAILAFIPVLKMLSRLHFGQNKGKCFQLRFGQELQVRLCFVYRAQDPPFFFYDFFHMDVPDFL